MIAGRNPFSKSTVPYATEKEFMKLPTLSSENILILVSLKQQE
jgi:hypothetical protein